MATVKPTVLATAIQTALNNGQIVQEYAKDIWSTADTLRGAGFKESEWPKFMMPFFALVLVISRILRARDKTLASFAANGLVYDPNDPEHRSDFEQEYHRFSTSASGQSAGFHPDLVFHGQDLAYLTASANPATFDQVLGAYLMGFDPETRRLLGVDYVVGQDHYLDIKGVIGRLNAKADKPLLSYTARWAKLDLKQFDTSEITTLEEHIKRRWADISAETSGEQFTPRDLIELIAALVVSHMRRYPNASGVLNIYDPTCGGGNMLFGVEDAILRASEGPNPLLSPDGTPYSVRTFGQELNDTLYALASFEARFRDASKIAEGNTLTNDKFPGQLFDIIVSNPPYGVDWKNYKSTIEEDTSGRFDPRMYPPTSDGQQLFLQHVYSHLADNGIALVYCSGSTLFSGDAGGGESNSRSHFTLTEDGVHGIIQIPKKEFFNTDINTYLWFFWKGKPEHLRHKLFLLNAEDMFVKLRKSLGSKANEISEDQRQKIVELEKEYDQAAKANKNVASPHGTSSVVLFSALMSVLRRLDVADIHYNKVTIDITRQDAVHGSLSSVIKLADADLYVQTEEEHTQKTGRRLGKTGSTEQEFLDDSALFLDALDEGVFSLLDINKPASFIKQAINSAEWISIKTDAGEIYEWRTSDRVAFKNGQPLGRADLNVSVKWAGKKGSASKTLALVVEFTPDIETDTETTPFSKDFVANKSAIDGFLSTWVKDPFVISKDNPIKVGCELNFNRSFPKGETLRSISSILVDMAALDKEISELASLKAGIKK